MGEEKELHTEELVSVVDTPQQVTPKKKAPKKKKVKRERAKIYGHCILEVMKQKDICAQELADLIDTNAPHIHRILTSKRPCLSLPIAMKISRALNTPIEELFYLNKIEKPKAK